MAEPCAYSLCTGTITDPTKAVTMTVAGENVRHFCRLTCLWIWLQDHVWQQQAQPFQVLGIDSSGEFFTHTYEVMPSSGSKNPLADLQALSR